MSDLISRSQLLKEIEKYKFGAISNDAEREYIKNTILDFINSQPTAYDIDKVIDEFRCGICESCSLMEVCAGSKYCKKCHEKIIEIVKQGGVDDDVCEWRLCDEEANVYDTSCRNLHIMGLFHISEDKNNWEITEENAIDILNQAILEKNSIVINPRDFGVFKSAFQKVEVE